MAAKYFAIIEGEQCGPFGLEELAGAGVRPSTYVWSKDMADWMQAEEVAEICRYFRQSLSGVPVGTTPVAAAPVAAAPVAAQVNEDEETSRHGFRNYPPVNDDLTDEQLSRRPLIPLASAVLSLICFPPTAVVALYQSIRADRLWKRTLTESNPKDKRALQALSHDASRLARMWLGITLSLGMVLYAFLLMKT